MQTVPEMLRPAVVAAWEALHPHIESLQPEYRRPFTESFAQVIAASPFVGEWLQRHPDLLLGLVNNPMFVRALGPGEMVQRCQLEIDAGLPESELMAQLRIFRSREMVRIAWRDLAGWADLPEVMQTMSGLADGLLRVALGRARQEMDQRFGQPIGTESGATAEFIVLGLGKLGGEELNFSSDIDPIFVYTEDGETSGERPTSNHEYFTRLGQKLIKLLGEQTADGIVFRVDMRLRPNGNSGPLALSFDAMEHYYQAHGRDWERYALIKARVCAGDVTAGKELLLQLRPFVFRKYLDFGAVESIREMKSMINQELQRKGIEDNVKLGPGGIREIEFIGQAFQLIRGGRESGLQRRSILSVLPLLVKNGQLTERALHELTAAYDFLRRTEHRLQMIGDKQTHLLPKDEANQLRVMFAMGFAQWDEFIKVLRKHMHKVHDHFEQVFVAPQGEASEEEEVPGLLSLWRGLLDEKAACELLRSHGYKQPEDAFRLLTELRGGRSYVAFSKDGRERMDRLMPLLVAAAGLVDQPGVTLARLIKLIESIGRRSSYFMLLIENPLALSQLVKLFSASAWIADWISQHPVVMDELIDATSLYSGAEYEMLRADLEKRVAQIDAHDLEAQMNLLREYHHGHVLRVAAADIGPGLEPQEIGSRLSNLAQLLVEQSLNLASAQMIERHGLPTCKGSGADDLPFAVIGYGKLGSRELGYSSDIDMAFLYGDCEAGAMTRGAKPVVNEVFFARLGQRLIHILNTRTPAGTLYEVDMRLRPSGSSGPLVTSLAGFERYQLEKAWVWEHQALVRARVITGSEQIRTGFDQVRKKVLCQQRDADALRRDVLDMREKMRSAQEPVEAECFHLKHDAGGIVDIEFMVQYGVLKCAHDHPELTEQTSSPALLAALVGAGFIDQEQCGRLSSAYLYFLKLEYRRKLLGKKPVIRRSRLEQSPQPVIDIWRQVFELGEGSPEAA